MKQDDKQSAVILSVIGILPVVWLALLIAPSVKGGLPEILPKLMTVFNNPFQIELCEDSLKLSSFCFCATASVSAFISQHAGITDAGRNTARQNGAMHELSIRNTAKRPKVKIS